MNIKSLRYNFFMAFLRMFTGMLSPIIIMPYVNKIFGSTLIGEIEYANTIISYFVLFTCLGIPIYGMREIASVRESDEQRSIVFYELMIIIAFTTIIAYIGYFYIIKEVSIINFHKKIFYIFSLNILLISTGAEWFFQGIEEQKMITKRNITIRILSMLCIFLFVNTKKNYNFYLIILTLEVISVNLINIFSLKKYLLNFKKLRKKLKPKRHLNKVIILFLSSITILIYTQIDIIMLGNMLGMSFVGIYTLPIKFVRITTSVIVLFGTTLLPRISNVFYMQQYNEYKKYLEKTLSILCLYSFLIMGLLYFNSEYIIKIFGGNEFYQAISTLKISSLTVFFSGLSYFYGIIVLHSQKKEKYFLYCSVIAALINVILNYFLIPIYKQNGAAIATLFSEIVIVLFINIVCKDYLYGLKIICKNNFKYIISIMISVFLSKIILTIVIPKETIIVKLLINSFFIGVFYMILLYLFKEENIENMKKIYLNKKI